MGWQVFLAISVIAESLGRTFQRYVLKNDKSNPIFFIIWVQLLGAFFTFIYSLIAGSKLPANINPVIPNLLLTPVFYSLGPILIFKALQQTEASVFTILFNARAIFVVLGAVVLLNNPFGAQQVLGTMLILAAVVAISFQKTSFQFKKGEVFSLLGGFFIAAGTINDSFALKVIDPILYVSISFLSPGLVLWIFNIKSTSQILAILKTRMFLKIALLSFIFSITFLSYSLAYKFGNNAAQIGAIFPVSSILTVLLSVVFLNERQRIPVKIAAALISFLGVYLLIS